MNETSIEFPICAFNFQTWNESKWNELWLLIRKFMVTPASFLFMHFNDGWNTKYIYIYLKKYTLSIRKHEYFSPVNISVFKHEINIRAANILFIEWDQLKFVSSFYGFRRTDNNMIALCESKISLRIISPGGWEKHYNKLPSMICTCTLENCRFTDDSFSSHPYFFSSEPVHILVYPLFNDFFHMPIHIIICFYMRENHTRTIILGRTLNELEHFNSHV